MMGTIMRCDSGRPRGYSIRKSRAREFSVGITSPGNAPTFVCSCVPTNDRYFVRQTEKPGKTNVVSLLASELNVSVPVVADIEP